MIRGLAALLLVPGLLAAAAAQAAFTFTRISAPVFYTDTSVTPQIPCNYVGFAVTSSTAVADGWATIGGYSSNLGNSPYEDGRHHLGSFAAGQTKYAYFYVCSSYTTTGVLAGQGYTVSMLDRNPAVAGAVTLGSQAFTTTIANDVIQANPNQVSVIFAGPNPAVLGGIITMTVEGDTGTIGDAPGPQGPLAFTPAAYTDWRADAYELVSSNVQLSGGNSGSYDNQLYIASLASSATTHYVVTYQFRAVTTTSTATNLSPIAEIASGTQIKHTSTTSGAYGGQLLPIDSATNTLLLTKLVSAATLPQAGGTVTYTLRVTNSSSYAVAMDDFVDTLPAGVTYVANSSTFGGVAIGNPYQSGQVLTWNSIFTIPGGATRDLVFQAVIPPAAGLYTNSAIGHIGPTVIDTTLTTSDNAPATAATRVLGPATLAKGFAPVAAAAGSPLTLTLTLSNNNATNTLTGVAVNDPYPAGLVNHSTPNAATDCPGGTLSGGSAGGNSIGVTGVTLAPGASCTVTVNVTSAVSAAYTNTTGSVTSANGGTGAAASALATFTSKPALTKSFAPASVALGSSSRVTVLVTNNNTVSLTGLAFSDPLPAGMTVAATPNLANTCGGTVTGATAGSSSVALAGGAVALPATTCSIAFDVTANAAGTYANVTTGATSNETGTAGPVSNAAVLTVMAAPGATKAFSPTAIARNEVATLTITLSNTNAVAITGAAFTDTYPAGLVNAASPAATTTCAGGSVTAAAGAGTVSLSGASIVPGGSCTVTVNVTAAAAGTYNNTLAIGAVTSANAGASTAAASASLTVTNKPTIVKAFATNPGTGITTMSFTITNNFTAGISALAFSDVFPTGMEVDATPTLTNTCGGTITGGTAGSTTLSLANGAIGTAGGTCAITLRVRVNSSGVFANQASGVTSTQTGTAGTPSNMATLVAPGLTKTFSPSTIGPGDVARMTVTVTNPSGTAALTGLQFGDTYPAGLVNTGTPAVANTCGGTTTGGAAAGTTFGLSGGALAAGGTCSISINVTSNAVNSYYNQTGTVRSNEGIGIDGADTLYVTARPTIAKSFAPASVLAGATSTMTLVVENNHTAGITGLAFSDPFPTGLVVAATPAITNSCNGTVTAAAGSASLALAGGSIAAANGTCTITVAVTAAAQGVYANQTNGATSTTTGATPGPRSNIANLTVNLATPSVAKAFSPATVGVNGASTLTITLTNGAAAAVTGVNFTDTYPAGMVNSAVGDVATTCGGSATAAAGGNSVALVGGSIPAAGSCTVTVSVESATAGTYLNSTGAVTTANAGTATAASATLTVLASLSATKSFAPSPVGAGVASVLTLVLNNPNAVAATGVSFTDTYPAGLVNTATPAGAIGGAGCSGTVTAAANGGALALASGSIPAGGSCTITVNVTAAAAGSYMNVIPAGAITSANAGANAAPAQATLVVLAPLTVAKGFAAASIGTGDTSVLTITLTNPNAVAVTGAAFTDTYPANLVNTAAANGATTCVPGSATAANNGNSVTLAGATVPAGGSCVVTVNVTSATAGTYDNTTGAVTTTNAGPAAAANATLTVLGHVTATKAFAPASLAPGAASVLTITLTNPNAATALLGAAFTDTYPAGLVNTATPAGATTCAGGTVTAASNGNSVVLSGATIPAAGSCTVTVNVTAATAGTYGNTLAAGAITTANGGASTAAVSATLVVTDPLTATKAFAPAAIGTGDTSVLTITLANPNPVGVTGIAFTDAYPANLVNTATPAAATTCAGGAVAALAAGTSVALTGASIPAGGSCTVTVNVTSATAGSYLNSTGPITAANAANGTAATATLDVLAHPVVAKSFAPASIGAGGTAVLTIRLTNPNATALAGAAFTDTYVAGLVNATPAGGTNGCGGTLAASDGANAVALSGGTVPANGSCEVAVTVTAAAAGSYVNTLAAGSVATTNGGANTAAGSATLTVLARPTVTKAFGTSPIAVNGTSTLTITLANANATAITGAAFTDTYPANVANGAAPAGATTCAGGTVTAAPGGPGVTLSGATIPANGACTVTVQVTASAAGSYVNTITAGGLATTNAGSNAAAASATLTVLAPPTLAKAFAPNPSFVGGTSVLTITLANGNATALTGAAFTDTYPAGLANTATPAGATTCAGGSVTAAANGNSVTLAGGTIPANGSCTVTVNVTPTASGSLANTLAAGAVTTTNGGSNAAAATDTLTVLAAPAAAKAFSGATMGVGATNTLTITLTNTNATAITGVAFNDTFPAGMVNVTPANAATTCGGTLTATAGSAGVTLAGGTIPANGSCTVTTDVTVTAAGSYTNTLAAGSVTSTNAGASTAAASATVNVLGAPTAAKAFAPATIAVNGVAVLTITLSNANAFAIGGAGFTDNYPAGLVNTGTPGGATTCAGGAVTAAANGTSLSLAGATIPANGSCTVTVNVTAAAAGSYVNTTGAIISGNAGSGTAASGTLRVFAAPTVAKSFSPASIAAGGTSTMTLVVANPATNPAALTGVAIADAYPAGLANAAAGSVACSAGGSATLAGGANGGTSVGFNAGTVAAGGTCTITQLVSATSTVTNTTGTATSNEAAAGTAAAATLTVASAPTIAKAFSPATVAIGGTSTITFTLANPNATALTGGAFTDALTGMVIDANGAATGTCAGAGGNVFAADQANLSFTGLTIPASASCTVAVVVRATSVGTLANTASGVASNQAATGAVSNTATLTVTAAAPTLAKAFAPATIDPGAPAQLTITLGNANGVAYTVTGVTDTFPAGMAPAAVPNAATTCAGGTVASNATSVTLTGGTVPANGTCTVTIDVTSATSGASLVNTIAAGALATSVGANTAAASATLTVRPQADLAIAKTGPASVAASASVTYTLVVSNAGPQPAHGALFSDTVPAAVQGVGASCAAAGGAACGTVNVAGNAVTSTVTTLPAGGSVTFTVTGTAPTSGSFTNTAQVLTPAGTYDPTDPTRTGAGNNQSAVTTSVVSPDLRVAKTHAGSFSVGGNGTYTITVDNTLGTAPTSGTITVTDTLPNGLSFVSAAGTGWTCGAAGQVVTCTSSAVIPAGATSANPVTLVVGVGAAAAPSVVNTASVSGGGEPAAATGNNAASDPTAVTTTGTSTFAPDNTVTASAGTTVSYAHTFNAGTAGTLTFSATSLQTPAVTGWTQVMYRDSDCSGTLNGAEGATPLTGSLAVAAGDTVCIVVRDAIPLTAPQNAQNAVTVTATLNAQSFTRTDLTIVGAGSGAGLVLNKQVRNVTQGGAVTTANTARPNDVLEYTVTYTNTGASPVTQIVVTDSTPSFTLFQSAACTLPLPANITSCSVTAQPAVNGAGSVSWTLGGSLQSGASGTVSFTVRVQP